VAIGVDGVVANSFINTNGKINIVTKKLIGAGVITITNGTVKDSVMIDNKSIKPTVR
jgi:hypothetical protein